ncbi:MAG: DNA translocase FtsK [Gemella sp.]|nr:DNA translocase FtsK [Gemella sp.]
MSISLYINSVYPNRLPNYLSEIFNKIKQIFHKKNTVTTNSNNKVDLDREKNVINEYYDNIKNDELEIDINEFKVEEEKVELLSNEKKRIPKPEIGENNDSISSTKENNVDYANYKLPPLDLLSNPIENKKISKEDIVSKSKILQSTFKNFGIEVKIVKAVVGPSITQFQILPTPGTKVSKITNLSSDIALNLAAKDIRIEAPIPGKSLIGIEIPNTINQLVTMKEVFINNEDDAPLSVTLGKDVSGESIFARLDKMPHLLVAGSTGSGKSVCVNTIITSILLKNRPDQVKLIMIDPKMVELSIYDGIPHLLTPVVTNPLKAADVLHKVVLEMERRYREFSIARVKNIEGYNKIAQKDEEYKVMPYMVVIIDELADLMLVASKEVEESIARITQMARAAGIHLIIATQRPSVDVITGVIKSNIPSRIAFAVSSSIDSRTILDKSGAETLLGKGDMLFQSADSSKPIRIQGAFLSDQEVENIVDYIKNQAETEYDPSMQPSENSSREITNSEEIDPLYHEVLLFIAKQQKASASLLQRRFKIGYNRAARIIETLEEDGYIGPADSSKPRKVFLEPEFAENNE